MSAWIHDLRSAGGVLLRRPALSVHIVGALALGMGACVALFAYLSYFKRPLIEAPDPGRLVWVFHSTAEDPTGQMSQPDFYDLADAGVARSLESVAGWRAFGASVQAGDRTSFGWGHAVSGGFFGLFGARPALGRLLGPEDDRPGAPAVLVVSHRFWRSHLGADPNVVGASVRLDGRRLYTLVGVAAPGFQGPAVGMSLYLPLATAGDLLQGSADRAAGTISVLARSARDATPDRVAAGLAAVARAIDERAPLREPRRLQAVAVADYNAWLPDDPLVRGAEALTAAVGCLLLLACANIANLMLARLAARRRDLAVHAALGATRGQLARPFFLESLILAAAGGLLGLTLVRPVLALIEAYLVETVPVGMGEWGLDTHLAVDPWLLAGVCLGLTVVVTLVVGVAPVLVVARQDLLPALRSEKTTGEAGRLSGRRLLVTGQVALSLVLLAGTGLFLRGLWSAREAPLGFHPEGRTLVTLHVPPGAASSQTPGELFGQILEEVRALPGVRSASLVSRVPPSPLPIELDVAGPTGETVHLPSNVVADRYLATLGIPLLAGRDFDARDGAPDAPIVAVVSALAGERLWPGRAALGQRLEVRSGSSAAPERYEVVGVAADSLAGPPTRGFKPQVYLHYRQRQVRRLTLVVWADAALGPRLHQLLRRNHPELAILGLQPLSEQLRRALADQRLNADFASGLGVLGLLLSVQGIFSLMSYSVARRTREIGLRQALGADRKAIARLVLAEALRILGVGVVLGSACAAVFARVLESRIEGIDGRDPLSLVGAVAVLVAVGLLAAVLPARRAARIDPAAALRSL
jgi:putative ABC transport system permease protein